MGWIGWSFADAMAADVNAVSLALAAKTDLLNQIYGDPKKAKTKPVVTAKTFHDMAKIHNRNWKRQRGNG